MELTFWLAIGLVVYVYAGYPVLLRVWARAARTRVAGGAALDCARARAGRHPPSAGRYLPLPGVSIVIAAHNEGLRLAARLDNLRALDYPPARRQIIVVSDGSTDDTAAVVGRCGPSTELVEVPRSGKALALNAGVARAKFDIVVFADARQRFAPDALRHLVAPFVDPQIGGVTGELLLDCETALFANRRTQANRRRTPADGHGAVAHERRSLADRRLALESTIGEGVGLYWRYEKHLRRLESAVGSTLGATGAIYAIRRALWSPLPADTILDDVLTPMRVVMAGFRVVFDERARAFDRAAADADGEARRKIRTLAGNFQILWLEPRLLAPWRNPVWFQYASHKLGRLVVPYALLAAFAASLALAPQNTLYSAALAGEVAFLVLAGYGALIEHRVRMPELNEGGVPARRPA
jgi:cellulose synthase/poly-beta-1,6-N-acetylglucosamine synthase-like glycosyltransferase